MPHMICMRANYTEKNFMLINDDKEILSEIKDTADAIEDNLDNKYLIKFLLGKLKLLTDKLIISYFND